MPATRPVISLLAAAACAALAVASASAAVSASTHARLAPAPGAISVVAGGAGGPGLATTVALASTNVQTRNCGVAYGGGNLYIGDGTAVRAVGPGNDRLTTPAGTGAPGPLGNTGPAARAALLGACGVVLDHSGNLVIADGDHNQVRVVAETTGTFYGQAMKAGNIYRIAGLSRSGFGGDGGPAIDAKLSAPSGVTVDSAGNLVIGDSGNNRIRVIAASTGTFYGQAMAAGNIYTVAGNGISGWNGDGVPAASAELGSPRGVAVDQAGNLLIADDFNLRVRVVAGKTGTFYGQPMTAGNIYTVAGDGSRGFSGDGGPATDAELNAPTTVAPDAAGNLVISDQSNSRVRVVATSTGTFYGQAMMAGDIYSVAGNGAAGFSGDRGPATSAELNIPDGAVTDGMGNLVINDQGNARVRVVAASTGTFYGQPMTAGDIYTIAGNGKNGFSGDHGLATAAELNQPYGIAVAGNGSTVIADQTNGRVRLTAAVTGTFYGQAMTAGHIYTVAGNGRGGFSGDGGPATHAGLTPLIPAVDAAGNILVTTVTGQVRAIAASTGAFYGQAMTAGDIYTIANSGAVGRARDSRRPCRQRGALGYVHQRGAGGRGQHRDVLRPGHDRGPRLHRGRHRHRWVQRRRHSGDRRRAARSLGGGRGRDGQSGDRRREQPAGARGGREDRHVLRPGHDGREHLHRGRLRRLLRLLRQWHPGHHRPAHRSRRPHRRRPGQPDLCRQQLTGAGGGREDRHVLRSGHDRRRHLHPGREWGHLPGQWRPCGQGRVQRARPGGNRCGQSAGLRPGGQQDPGDRRLTDAAGLSGSSARGYRGW